MLTRTLQDMISEIRNRTNFETSTFVTDQEITGYLNVALRELWMRLTQSGGQPFYRAVATLNVTAGQSLYNLPVDFLTLQGVEGLIYGVQSRIDSFMPSEHASLIASPITTYGSSLRYRIQGNTIELIPATMGFAMTLYYTPTCPVLINSSDTFDGFDGYEIGAIYQACAAVQSKEESDPQFYMAERDRIYKMIDQMASVRDQSAPERVSDVMSGNLRMGGWW